MDLVLRNVGLVDGDAVVIADIGIADGRIAAVEPGLKADAEEMDLEGRFAVAGFVESHIHLDKACILDRCKTDEGTLEEAIREVAKAKKAFTVEDIRRRADSNQHTVSAAIASSHDVRLGSKADL